VDILCAYFGGFSCINAYKFKGLLEHKNLVPTYDLSFSYLRSNLMAQERLYFHQLSSFLNRLRIDKELWSCKAEQCHGSVETSTVPRFLNRNDFYSSINIYFRCLTILLSYLVLIVCMLLTRAFFACCIMYFILICM
jgi:hypothetical protein